MSTIALDPVSRNMVMYDILNEPDCRGIGWEGAGPGRSMASNYLAVMDQVHGKDSCVDKFRVLKQRILGIAISHLFSTLRALSGRARGVAAPWPPTTSLSWTRCAAQKSLEGPLLLYG